MKKKPSQLKYLNKKQRRNDQLLLKHSQFNNQERRNIGLNYFYQ